MGESGRHAGVIPAGLSLQESGKRASIDGAKSQVVSLLSSSTATEVLDGILSHLCDTFCATNLTANFFRRILNLSLSLIVEFSHLSKSGTDLCLMDEMLQEILKSSAAKNKVVRNRACELLCHIVALRSATQFKLADWEVRIYDEPLRSDERQDRFRQKRSSDWLVKVYGSIRHFVSRVSREFCGTPSTTHQAMLGKSVSNCCHFPTRL